MRALARSGSRLAFVVGLGIAQLVACSSDTGHPSAETQRTGTLGLALQTMGQSGAIYRLREAVFQIVDRRTGDTVDFLFSEDSPASAPEIRKVLLTGNYNVTLLDGWFIERLANGKGGGSGGTGATAGRGGTGSGASGGVAGKFGSGGSAGKFGAGGSAGEFPVAGAGTDDDLGESGHGQGGGDFGEGGDFGGPSTGGSFSVGGSTSPGGFGPGGEGSGGTSGTGSGFPQIVEAQLVSDAVQPFSLFGFDETFVTYQFHVGEEVLDFNHGRLHIGIEIIEDPEECQPPDDVTDVRRVLIETNLAATSGTALSEVFDALVSNGNASGDGFRVYQEILDSYATADRAVLPDAIHCGDESIDGTPTLNGYPIQCNRVEHANHVESNDDFFGTAFVNRLDLAPQNGAHCGQQRMIFASNFQGFGRMFMIFEAQIPNPQPELGVLGCVPLAQFWLDQNAIDDPFERGARLREAFLFGSPELAEFGFGPFLTATNLTVGSGQIRTNQFDQGPWTLREFKLGLDGENVTAIPFPVAEAPHGQLWNEDSAFGQGEACRENFLTALDGLLTNDPSQMSFIVDNACKDAESRNDFSQNYQSQLSNGFRQQLEERLLGTNLNADDIANRARFAGSCIGCHEEATGFFLGDGVFAPFSTGFVHVSEFAGDCGGRASGQTCFQPSQALTEVFLPSRLRVLGQVLDIPIVDDPCQGTGGSGAGGSPGVGGGPSVGGFGAGGGFGTGGFGTGGFSMGGFGTGASSSSGSTSVAGSFNMVDASAPAPELDIELPSVDEPIADLQEEDEEIREAYGDLTLSGKSARSTH